MSGAVISDCGQYRYSLWRDGWLGGEGDCLFVMLNPSTADASEDDPTIRRCIGFAQRWGYGRLVVGNVYAHRATDPKALRSALRPVGEPLPPGHANTYPNQNDEWLRRMALKADRIVCAWGAHADPRRAREVFDVLSAHHFPVECLGLTKAGAPKHPLYLRADSEPVHFDLHAKAPA